MPKLTESLPKYRLHRASGQAVVTLGGRDCYLGPHGTETSRLEYDRLIAEWLTHGRHTPLPAAVGPAVSVNKIILAFWEHAKNYYRRPDGSQTTEVDNFRAVLRLLRRFYGQTPAADFGPRGIKTIREEMIRMGWCRRSIKKQISRVRMVFRWAVENELVPPSVHHALMAVRGLSKGRTEAKESEPVRPVPQDRIDAIKPFVSRQVWALIQLQLLTGARAGELVKLRGIDFKTADKIWIVEPGDHKTAHLGHAKRIYFGPQAKEVVGPFLQERPLDAFLFSPAEAETERRAAQTARRKTPVNCGNRPGTNRRATPKRRPHQRYTVPSYRRAIERGCDLAFDVPPELARRRKENGKAGWAETLKKWKERLGPETWQQLRAWRIDHRWHPHQLRHNAATHLRKEFGIEVARIILGHRSASVTEIYAELDDEKAKDVMQRIG
jgi:integrase